jgi:hypothetical protein
MNIDQADAIIAELNICFPSRQLIVEEVRRWEENLLPFHYEDAKMAVKRIEENSRFWPSWAEFREAIIPLHRQRQASQLERQQDRIRALEAPRTPEDEERIREIIQNIKNRFSERH